VQLHRGDIFKIIFPYTFDREHPNGKSKYVVVLQDGEYFEFYDTTVILLITKNPDCEKYPTDVKIEQGTTRLPLVSWINCAQQYPVRKSLFSESLFFGRLSQKVMDKVDAALYLGLCMGTQVDESINPAVNC
jgi:mRNA-degrading endonuclease toxin of MazEF toxin-antitoxin module